MSGKEKGIHKEEKTIEKQLSKLQKEGQKLAELINSLPIGIMVLDDEYKITYANYMAANFCGSNNIEELLSKKISNLGLTRDEKFLMEKINEAINNKETAFETMLINKEGKNYPLLITIKNIAQQDEKCLCCIIIDLNEQKKIEAKLLHESSFLKAIISKAADGICVCHDIHEYPYVKFTVWNQKMTEITGYTMEEINKLGWYQMMYPELEVQTKAIERMKRMRKGDDLVEEEWQITHSSGSKKQILISTSVLASADGKTHVMALTQDITERKREEERKMKMQQNLLEIQRLESLGLLASGIAHDFNNILMAIIGNLELTMLDIPFDCPTYFNLEQALKASLRASDLVRQILAYCGKGKYMVCNININDIIENNLEFFKTTISKNIKFELDLQKELPLINADASQITQLLINLITNASEAIDKKDGIIKLKTGSSYFDESILSKNHFADKINEGIYVLIEISDNGIGMDENTLQKICDPFFTTKFFGRGLGMAAVAGIIKSHNGTLFIESEPDKGTKIKVLLPIATSEITEKNISKKEEIKSDKFTGTILIVDDEKAIRDTLAKITEFLGFKPLLAKDGFEAIEILKKYLDQISCVLLDYTMPKMDGVDTFKKLLEIKADIKVIFTSGYTEEDATKDINGLTPAAFLQKPYRLEQLKEILNLILQ